MKRIAVVVMFFTAIALFTDLYMTIPMKKHIRLRAQAIL